MDTLITQVYNLRTAVDLKLALAEIYGDEYEVYFVRDAGLVTEISKRMPLYAIDRELYNHQCAIYVPSSDMPTLPKLLKKLEGGEAKHTAEELKERLMEDWASLLALDASAEVYLYEMIAEIYEENDGKLAIF